MKFRHRLVSVGVVEAGPIRSAGPARVSVDLDIRRTDVQAPPDRDLERLRVSILMVGEDLEKEWPDRHLFSIRNVYGRRRSFHETLRRHVVTLRAIRFAIKVLES